ncbi:hypothetical protein BDV98DRAFT_587187 [Pterulicium gracile]|uniref:Uncharacterized protein n=1 Tax=Pterulicium gracile TaxID=1884261 RepID=A0A5C3Q503_9AGAR|nr:hypothetical protein BDV98DRAFT_587187 [Pterula gracilis]
MNSLTELEDPTNLTPEVTAILSYMGNTLNLVIGAALIRFALYDAYFRKRPEKTARTLWFLLALFVTLLSVTFDLAALTGDLATIKNVINDVLLDKSTPSLFDRIIKYNTSLDGHTAWIIAATWITALNMGVGLLFLINDILASWRAIALWAQPEERESHLFSLFSSLFLCHLHRCQPFNDHDGWLCSLDMTWKLTIFAAIARQHWQSDSRVPGTKIGRGAKVLIYLTESGAFYAVLQITRIGVALSVTPSTLEFGSLYSNSYNFLNESLTVAAMYSPAVILIVKFGVSIADTVQLSSGQDVMDRHTVSTIRFGELNRSAVANTNKIADDEHIAVGKPVEDYL